MIRRLLLLAALLCAPALAPLPAQAQQAIVVSTCGALSYDAGPLRPLTQDATGTLCTAAGPAGTTSTVAQASTTSGQAGTLVQGAVTTAAPTYTTGKTNPLSLTTAGALRTVDLTSVTQGSTTSGQSGQLIQGSVTTAAPTYTTAQTSPLSLTTTGQVRTEANITVGTGGALIGFTPSVDALSTGGYYGLPTYTVPFVYNGATTDRMRGNTTGSAIINGGLPASHWRYAAATSGLANTTTAVTAKTAAGAAVLNCVENVQIAHSTLGGITEFVIRDGAAGTVIWRTVLQTAASEGATYNLSPAICGTANTLLEFAEITAVTGAVYFNAQGYVSP